MEINNYHHSKYWEKKKHFTLSTNLALLHLEEVGQKFQPHLSRKNTNLVKEEEDLSYIFYIICILCRDKFTPMENVRYPSIIGRYIGKMLLSK